MSKQHPIRKMQRGSRRIWQGSQTMESEAVTIAKDERFMLRSVKPLLDALGELSDHGDEPCDCKTCRLLAAWREPIK